MEGASHHDNAVATAKLLQAFNVKPHTLELCVGVYNGKREAAVRIDGFSSKEEAVKVAMGIATHFAQEAVLLVTDDNKAYSVSARCCIWAGYAERSTNIPQAGSAHTAYHDGTFHTVTSRKPETAADWNKYALAA